MICCLLCGSTMSRAYTIREINRTEKDVYRCNRKGCIGEREVVISRPDEDTVTGYDFSGLTVFDLIILQKRIRDSGEDKEFLDAILKELGRRQKDKGKGG